MHSRLRDADKKRYQPEELTGRQVLAPGGEPYVGDPDSPVVVLGDSFTGVLELTDRVWVSDNSDPHDRQSMMRWSVQLAPPEYLGAHVSSPVAHQTGRTLPLDFRAGTAMFGAFGVEWDLSTASDDELDALAEWVALHKQFRSLLHSGRLVRPESSDPAVLLHGVVSTDGDQALLAHVQLDESASNRGTVVRVPGLADEAAEGLGGSHGGCLRLGDAAVDVLLTAFATLPISI